MISCTRTRRAHDFYLFKNQSAPEPMSDSVEIKDIQALRIKVEFPSLMVNKEMKKVVREKVLKNRKYFFRISIARRNKEIQKIIIRKMEIRIIFKKKNVMRELKDIRAFVFDKEAKLIQFKEMKYLPEEITTIDSENNRGHAFDYYIWDDFVRCNNDLDEKMTFKLKMNIHDGQKIVAIDKEYQLRKVIKYIPDQVKNSCLSIFLPLD